MEASATNAAWLVWAFSPERRRRRERSGPDRRGVVQATRSVPARDAHRVDDLLAAFVSLTVPFDERQLARAVVHATVATTPADSVAVTLVEPTNHSVHSFPVEFFDRTDQLLFEELHHAEPWKLAVHTRDPKDRPIRSSDVYGQAQYRALPIYRDLFRKLEIEHQAAFSLPYGDALLCVAINRSRCDFSDAEVATLAALQSSLGTLTRTYGRGRAVAPHTDQFPSDVSTLATLTHRERSVLRLATIGLTDLTIGHRLGISTRTVNKHLQHVYTKLQVSNRTEASAIWHHSLATAPEVDDR